MNDLCFQVADACFRVRFLDIPDGRGLLPSYGAFYVERPQSLLLFTLEVGEGLVDASPGSDEIGQMDCGGCNHGIYREAEGGYKMLVSDLHGTLACAFRTSADFSRCQASLHGEEETRRFGLNNAVMIAFAFAGAHRGILLMHASVPMKDGKGYLFLGKSGTGKSTHSRLWLECVPGADLLNDDNPAVRIREGVTYVYGTPWSGKTPCYRNLRMRAGGFLRLRQWPRNLIGRDTGLKAFASVFSSCSTMIWDKPSYDAICETVSQVVERVPVFHLSCRPDWEAAELSYRTMAGA